MVLDLLAFTSTRDGYFSRGSRLTNKWFATETIAHCSVLEYCHQSLHEQYVMWPSMLFCRQHTEQQHWNCWEHPVCQIWWHVLSSLCSSFSQGGYPSGQMTHRLPTYQGAIESTKLHAALYFHDSPHSLLCEHDMNFHIRFGQAECGQGLTGDCGEWSHILGTQLKAYRLTVSVHMQLPSGWLIQGTRLPRPYRHICQDAIMLNYPGLLIYSTQANHKYVISFNCCWLRTNTQFGLSN